MCSSRNGITVIIDSQSATKLAENEGINRRHKNVEMTSHIVCEVISRGDVLPVYERALHIGGLCTTHGYDELHSLTF